MVAIFSLLLVIAFSILINRIATVALMHTGLSRETARFQARSALTGVGYTTDEAETIVRHPVRRRIVQFLMLLGNAGVVTAISSLILSFLSPGGTESVVFRILIMAGGIGLLIFFSRSRFIDFWLSKIIHWALRTYTTLDAKDYASLLHVQAGYRIAELKIRNEDWLANRTLGDTKLRDEGVNVLGLQRKKGKYIGALRGDTRILPGDTLLLYGRSSSLEQLDVRGKGADGDAQHNEAVSEEQERGRE